MPQRSAASLQKEKLDAILRNIKEQKVQRGIKAPMVPRNLPPGMPTEVSFKANMCLAETSRAVHFLGAIVNGGSTAEHAFHSEDEKLLVDAVPES